MNQLRGSPARVRGYQNTMGKARDWQTDGAIIYGKRDRACVLQEQDLIDTGTGRQGRFLNKCTVVSVQ
jgi:hypothetical protein